MNFQEENLNLSHALNIIIRQTGLNKVELGEILEITMDELDGLFHSSNVVNINIIRKLSDIFRIEFSLFIFFCLDRDKLFDESLNISEIDLKYIYDKISLEINDHLINWKLNQTTIPNKELESINMYN